MSGFDPNGWGPLSAPFCFSAIDFSLSLAAAKCRHHAELDIAFCEPCLHALFRQHCDAARSEIGVTHAPDVFGEDSPWHGDRGVEHLAALELALQQVAVEGTTPTHSPGAWQSPPRWPSTLGYVESQQGGFTGVTAIAGTEGIGKSLLAHASAVNAALSGDWAVFYLNAEMSKDELDMRWDGYEAIHPEVRAARDWFWRVNTPPGFKPPDLVAFVQEQIARTTYQDGHTKWPPNMLIVLDSINTIAKLMGGNNYMQDLDLLGMWAMQARKISRGHVAFLVIGEQNVRGGIKGEQLNYWSDIFLRMSRNDKHHELIDFEVRKARQGPSQAPAAHKLDYENRRFTLAEGFGL